MNIKRASILLSKTIHNSCQIMEEHETRSFYIFCWNGYFKTHKRYSLEEYISKVDISENEIWNIIFEVFSLILAFYKCKLLFKSLPVDRIFLSTKGPYLDIYDFLYFDQDLNVGFEEIIKSNYNPKHLSALAPEYVLGRKLTSRSLCWLVGSLIFRILEVC